MSLTTNTTSNPVLDLATRVLEGWHRAAIDALVGGHSCPGDEKIPNNLANEGLFQPSDFLFDEDRDLAAGFLDVVFGAVAAAAGKGPRDAGSRILAEAYTLASSGDVSSKLAKASSYDSVNPAVVGSFTGHPKCNVFAGDVLWSAGFEVPSYELRGHGKHEGKTIGVHYKEAERWPKETAFFDKVTDLADVRPGDVLIVDYKHRQGSGGGAHVEIITSVDHDAAAGPRFTSMGARTGGLVENDFHASKLRDAKPAGDHFAFAGGNKLSPADIYVLRPKRLREGEGAIEGGAR